MKRLRETNSSSNVSRNTKRAKSVQACANCKKNKTRCEILDVQVQQPIRCHRCRVLEVECSYQDMDRGVFESHLTVKEKSRNPTPETITEIAPGYASTSAPANAPGSSNASMPEDVYPNKPHQLWDFIRDPKDSLDWSAPLQAMGQLMKQASTSSDPYPPPPPPVFNDSLDNILSPDQIHFLINTFERDYLPWLNYTPIHDTHRPILDLIYCTITSRHLDESTCAVVAPRLNSLTADKISKIIFQPRPSEKLEAIQSLIILSLWSPLFDPSEDGYDGRLLVASAVSMAHDMHLDDAPQQAITLKQKSARGEHVLDKDMADAMNNSRLWFLLTNVESLVCLGSGRNPLSKRNASYLVLLPLSPHLDLDDIISGRDLRQRLLAEVFDIVEAGFAIRFQSLSEKDINAWYAGFTHVLSNLARVTRVILPLSVVSKSEQFYYKFLNIIVRSCRLLILYQAAITVRQYFLSQRKPSKGGKEKEDDDENDNTQFWFRQVRPHGLNVLIIWGRESMMLSESILVTLLELDIDKLGAVPDYMFNMIAFAASYIIGCRILVLRSFGFEIPGSGEKLMKMCIERLERACQGCGGGGVPMARKAAVLIKEMQEKWEARLMAFYETRSRAQVEGNENAPTTAAATMDSRRALAVSQSFQSQPPASHMNPHTPSSSSSPSSPSPFPQPALLPFLGSSSPSSSSSTYTPPLAHVPAQSSSGIPSSSATIPSFLDLPDHYFDQGSLFGFTNNPGAGTGHTGVEMESRTSSDFGAGTGAGNPNWGTNMNTSSGLPGVGARGSGAAAAAAGVDGGWFDPGLVIDAEFWNDLFSDSLIFPNMNQGVGVGVG
ncbi:hypothetical protein D9757_001127 [Collybiopsis confluens]|uniref:Zn(2)-C6 fungal-type domain-containing protein n=1 Tax=Collybiopsis confluens TaxID=2823264 RepID=A0A8H5I0V6_9AGAR|nr:hypothetical protein D9757_001127 [Collybiopsis confluens]